MGLQSYQEVVAYLKNKKRTKHLLLGNGFSMAYDSSIFSYNALSRFIEAIDNELLLKLFEIIRTKNFELVLQQLDNFCSIADAFSSDKSLVGKIKTASDTLKQSLIDAVNELHPEHVFTMPESKSKSCAVFLNEYLSNKGQVFTTNYDLLLYWALMRNKVSHAVDGFGRDRENMDEYVPEDELEYSELRWGKHKDEQNVHYLHGALPLFDTGIDIVKEEYDGAHFLLDKINKRIGKKEYPIFITAGNGTEKLTHIMHNAYLSYCYEQLTAIEGSLVTFGFNFGRYDEHIIEAINIAAKQGLRVGDKLHSVYIGIYSTEDEKYITSITNKFKCKVNMYDAKTANIWGIN